MNLNNYVGKKIKMYYASPKGEVFDIGLVKSSNNNAAITLLKEASNELLTIGVYRITKIEILN
ncbi:hypothetical protein [Ammoniphilus sp. YIM 78166]|uniref:hypothetical protein n=1 Tax=Ammoniphilus sp. YIM 78166 TaxID=1644106 RepID=UPI00106FF799|nr:hypothetical protein [Ammoniphilus sp. YIM 78166]